MVAEVLVDIEKTFPSGPAIKAHLRMPLDGSWTVLFGPSGAGKSTLLRCLAGLERPEKGHIRFGSEAWFDAEEKIFVPPQGRSIGYVFQDHALFPHLSVKDNITYNLKELTRADKKERVEGLLGIFHLNGLENRYPNQLSAGEKQRVAIARALIRRPRLMLLDEPLTALDTPTREQLRGELRNLLKEFGIPIILVTHDRVEAISLGNRIVVMAEGQVLQNGPISEVFSKPVNTHVAKVVGTEAVVPGRVVEAEEGLITVEVGDARIVACGVESQESGVRSHPPFPPLRKGGMEGGWNSGLNTLSSQPHCFVCIRAEDVFLEQSVPATKSSPRNHLKGKVVGLNMEGPVVRVLISVDTNINEKHPPITPPLQGRDEREDNFSSFLLTAIITKQASQELALHKGKEIIASVKATAVHVISCL